jgi:NADPH-dependent 2,4-dienoyl-CoA reductase/sulfur reductase-like enzyme
VTAEAVGVAVVGAGVAGLAAAATFAATDDVTVYDRLPAVGGVLGYEHELVRELQDRCESRSVQFRLATTVVRWRGGRLLAAGPDGIGWHGARRLVNAAGARPSTAAELRLAGSRLAGVLPATVAIHLLEAGVVLGRHVVVIGAGWWAEAAAGHIRHQGAAITSLVPAGESPLPGVTEALVGWDAVEVHGSGRVEQLAVANGSRMRRLVCDAVVLAGELKPLRNVDGAIRPGDPAVEFIQPVGARIRAHEVAARAADASARLAHDRSGGEG